MKFFIRLFAVALFLSFSVTAMSCSKDNYKHNYRSKGKGGSTSAVSAEKKNKPVRKNFLIPNKKKKILGQQKPKSY